MLGHKSPFAGPISPFARPGVQPLFKANFESHFSRQSCLGTQSSSSEFSTPKSPWAHLKCIPNLYLQATFAGTRCVLVPFKQACAKLAMNPTIVSPVYVATNLQFKNWNWSGMWQAKWCLFTVFHWSRPSDMASLASFE